MANGRDEHGLVRRESVESGQDTPTGRAFAGQQREIALGDAVAELNALGIPLDAPLGEVQYVTNDGQPLGIGNAGAVLD